MNSQEPRSGLLLDAVYASVATSSKTLARIALYIAEQPEAVPTLSVTDIAKNTESGPASIVRFCRTLGFKGFGDFKIALAAEIERERAFKLAHDTPSEGTLLPPDLSNLSAAIVRAVTFTARDLEPQQIKRLAKRLQKARRIELFGMGASSVCCDILAIRLIWLGLPAHAPNSTSMSHKLAATLDSGSIAVGISGSGLTAETKEFLEISRKTGAHTVAITTRMDTPIAFAADEVILLSSARLWPQPGTALHVPSMVLISEYIAQFVHEVSPESTKIV